MTIDELKNKLASLVRVHGPYSGVEKFFNEYVVAIGASHKVSSEIEHLAYFQQSGKHMAMEKISSGLNNFVKHETYTDKLGRTDQVTLFVLNINKENKDE